ncbi:membrane protein insertase YidC [Candidatus Purcelliella pentastirinorum]|uniref:Membrane protein insertase YidC n=1 Tax=Candidatus Purcelliella pentastirinorum TaxID=472834 RepID=A0AAX3N917_9ENTR|nr:membrane protein insertase YidC [Candidatus Purcelliella pentastirinorum]WDI78607.1 membrane protein insertase YidC [Candidatus Purcelliella pentastirinorum]WDR80365.1 membrane protein insertase YidC [Candidatus Purcelliella pentastirinorum]
MYNQFRFIFIIFLFISCFLWQTWINDHLQSSKHEDNLSFFSEINNKYKDYNSIINVKTDVLSVKINAYGGDIEQAKLLCYSNKLNTFSPYKILEILPNFIYQAQSGILKIENINKRKGFIRHYYNFYKNNYKLLSGKDELIVPIKYTDIDGVIYTKVFIFKRGKYYVNVKHFIRNVSHNTLHLSMFGQLKQSFDLPEEKNINFTKSRLSINSFRGAAYSTENNKYVKYKFDDIIKNNNLNISTYGGWISMLQQYFITAWIPQNHNKNIFYTDHFYLLNKKIVVIGYRSPVINIPPGKSKIFNSILWIGPKIQNELSLVAPYLDFTVDYGFLWFISQPLFNLLKLIHNLFGNWGVSIIIITLFVRMIMYPLTKVQYISVVKMKMLQPKIEEIRSRFKNDKKRITQEMILLYKHEKVNPFGGCLPLIIQMPIFLALYYMLMNSIELRHANFIFWIHDLSSQDPCYILPILMGITMFMIQKISPNSVNDPIQKKVMNIMPFIFTIFFLWFPSGLVLYYVVSNLITILQQHIIYKSIKKHDL